MRRTLTALAGFLCTASAFAGPVQMSNDQIQSAIAGAKLEIDTPLGTKLPISYNNDGQMTGEAGSLASYLGAKSDHGRWWVARNRLCNKWEAWLEGKINCLTLEQDGQRIFWRRDDGEEGTATLVAPVAPPVPPAAQEKPTYALGGPEPVEPPAVIPAPVQEPESVVAAAKPAAPRIALKKPKIQTAKIQRVTKAIKKSRALIEPTFWVSGVENGDVLNMRQGPSSDEPVVATIAPGSRGVRIIGPCAGMWCRVKFETSEGWVNRSYLVYEIPETQVSSATHR